MFWNRKNQNVVLSRRKFHHAAREEQHVGNRVHREHPEATSRPAGRIRGSAGTVADVPEVHVADLVPHVGAALNGFEGPYCLRSR